MPIAAADLQMRLSGGTTNTSPAASLGGAASTQAGGLVTSGVSNNLWDDVTGAESAAGDIEYRGFYWWNNHGSLTLQGSSTWIDSLTSSADTEFDLALAAEAVNVAMATIANEGTAPATVTFSRPVAKGSMTIGDVPAGQFKGVWIRRTVTAGAAAANDSGSVRWEGDTAA